MKICAIQQPYAYDPADAPRSIQFLINELNSCDDSLDLILTPEYSNTPTKLPAEDCIPFVEKYTPALVNAAINAAKRCHAIVALGICVKTPWGYRNATRMFDRNGEIAGDYYKQQLVEREPAEHNIDNSYALQSRPATIIEIEGIRFGFVTCYDAYYDEYTAALAYRKPDVILVAAHQRGERWDILEMLNKSLAYHANAFVVRASVGMGEGKKVGGSSMVVDPSGTVLANAQGTNGKLICEIDDVHRKYMRSDSFGGKMISNSWFIEKGRTPWAYRACGSSVRLDERRMPYPRICAHRGFNTIAPENTMPAFGAAVGMGTDEIEFDLRKTLDNIPVILHDPDLESTSNGIGQVAKKTYAELLKLDFGSRFSDRFTGLRIAAFEDVLKKFPRQAIFNIHVKIADETFLRKIIDLLYLYDCANHAYIMGEEDVQNIMRKIAPEIPRCMAADPDRNADIVEKALRCQCSKVQFIKPYVNPAMIGKAHAHGIRCNLFWSDDPQETAEFLKAGIDTILTNDYWNIAKVVHPEK